MKKSELRQIIREEVQIHLNESLVIAAGAVVLGILGYKAIMRIIGTIVNIRSLKKPLEASELKRISTLIAEKAIGEASKNPIQVSIWKNAVDEKIDSGDITTAWELLKSIKGIDAIIQ